MITLIYNVAPENAIKEKQWLYDMKIYPAISDYYDWISNTKVVRFGVIVAPDAAIPIKLRHPLQFQTTYKQR